MSSHHLSSNPARRQAGRSKAYGLLLLNTALWGFASPITKRSLDFVTPNQFLLGRYLIASLVFLPIFFLQKKRLPAGRHGLILNSKHLLLALLGTPITLIPLYYGLTLTTSLEAAILVATGPLITIVGGWLFLKEKISRQEFVGITVALAGGLLLTISPLLNNTAGKFSLLGNLLIILSNFIWTVFLLIAKKTKTDASQISLVSYLVSIPVFALLVLFESPQISNIKYQISNAIPGIAYMAIFGSVIAFWAYAKGQELIEASEAAVFSYLQPLFALPLSVLWLHEPLTIPIIASSALIALGVYISEKR